MFNFFQNQSVFDSWDMWKLMPQLITIILTTIIITTMVLVYYFKVKKLNPDEEPRGFTLIIEIIISGVEKLVVDILGNKFKWLTVYILYLLGYIVIGNLLSIVGFESQMTSYTVTFSMALVTFIGIYIFGLTYQKWRFFKKYLIPTELLGQFAPLISLSFRIFGNITSGAIIMALIYQFTASVWAKIPVIGHVDFLAGLVAPIFHFYFDLFTGAIQGMIFAILTLVYWKLELGDDNVNEQTITVTDSQRYQNVLTSN